MVDSPPPSPEARAAARVGVFYGLAAYGSWGLLTLYFRALRGVAPLEVLAHRVAWSVPLLFLLLAGQRRLAGLGAVLKDRKTLLTLVVTTTLIAANWLIFVIAVSTDRVIESSLGYFINPLVNVLLGRVFLGERLRPWQQVSVALATVGVAYLTFSLDKPPVISLVLAGSFGFYGLLRKVAKVDGPTGLTVETSILFPFAIGFLAWQAARGELAFGQVATHQTVLMGFLGLVTALPLLWFAQAVRRLPLSTVGLIQYLSPSLQFLLAVGLFGEPFTAAHKVTFGCIWAALAIFSVDAWRAARAAPANQENPSKQAKTGA